jgi:outer membrane protein assembly factor BamB
MRRILIGASLVAAATLIGCFAWRSNFLSAAPLLWKASVDEYEGVWHVDKSSIYCVAHAATMSGSFNSICRIKRDSGKVLWRRKKHSKGDTWHTERPFCWTADLCYAGIGDFDRKTDETSKTALIAISLHDGSNRWEVPLSAEIRSIALGDSIYCLTNDGRLTKHLADSGVTISELDLRQLAGQRASYGGIQIFGNIAVVGSYLSNNYTKSEHAKVFLINLRTFRLITEIPKGVYDEGKYLIFNGENWESYDLSSDEPQGVTIYLPDHFFHLEASDGSGIIGAQMTESGNFQLLDSNFRPLGAEVSRANKIKHMTRNVIYLWDYRELRSVNRHTGVVSWATPMNKIIDHVSSSHEQVLVRCRGDTLYCLDANTGALEWKYHLNNEMGSPAWCEEGDVIVSEKKNILYFSSKQN